MADNAQTARRPEATVACWREIAAILGPVVGAHGFAALYRNSLRRTAQRFPWLLAADSANESDPFARLQRVLERQPAAEADEASRALAEVFRDLLDHLIGPALAQRLLGAQLPPAPALPKPAARQG